MQTAIWNINHREWKDKNENADKDYVWQVLCVPRGIVLPPHKQLYLLIVLERMKNTWNCVAILAVMFYS